MKIKLLQLQLINFKGIKDLTVSFDDITGIYGANATGKSTIADAWYWLLFGKNSLDQTDFNIKNTVDTSLNRAEHEVSATLEIDGENNEIKRVYKEKWVKKRGEETAEFAGNETLFLWDGVPLQLKEFQARIAKLVDEKIFKLITNPNYFNSIKWQDRRGELIRMAGTLSNDDIAGTDKELQSFVRLLGKDKLEDFRKKVRAEKGKIKDELDAVPARMDEANRSMPEAIDFDALQVDIDEATDDLQNVDGMLMNKTQAQKEFQAGQSKIHAEIHRIRRSIDDLKYKLRTSLEKQDRESQGEIETANQKRKSLTQAIEQAEKDLETSTRKAKEHEASRNKAREDWAAENAKTFTYSEVFTFDESSCACPTCKQALPADQIANRREVLEKNFNTAKESALTSFNSNKTKRLADLRSEGTRCKERQEAAEAIAKELADFLDKKRADLVALSESIATLESQYEKPRPIDERLTEVLSSNTDYLSMQEAIKQQEALILDEPQEDNSDLLARKKLLTEQLGELNSKQSIKGQIEKTKKRLIDLGDREKELSHQLAECERSEFLANKFEKASVEAVELRVNDKFKYVKFKLFDFQVNGAEVPCCETTYNGVPFQDLNTAGKAWAGIDIINALQEHYGVYAPIFMDNRESVSEIPETEAQIVNLIVSPADKALRIEAFSSDLATA